MTNKNYVTKSGQFVDVLLENYQTFIKIGKFVDRIDKNIGNTMSTYKLIFIDTQKNYSMLLRDLRKDVEEFTIDYVKYLKEAEYTRSKESELKERLEDFHFEDLEGLEKAVENNFSLDDFLNPKKGSKRWLEEQPEKMKVLIDEKKFGDCVALMKEIRKSDLDIVDYDVKLELDQVYNYLIERLTISIGVNFKIKN